jgi:hypothetical protein
MFTIEVLTGFWFPFIAVCMFVYYMARSSK